MLFLFISETANIAVRKDGQRNTRTEPDAEAGWVAVAVAVSGGTKVGDFEGKHERVTEAAAGRVNLELGSPAYRGATTQSNNTGELTALLRAIHGEVGATGRATFMVDSTYAINTATGRTVPSSGKGGANRLLATRLRAAYRLLQQERGDQISIQHVKFHLGVRGNEAADKLANMGADIEDEHRFVERGSTEPPQGRDEQTMPKT